MQSSGSLGWIYSPQQYTSTKMDLNDANHQRS